MSFSEDFLRRSRSESLKEDDSNLLLLIRRANSVVYVVLKYKS